MALVGHFAILVIALPSGSCMRPQLAKRYSNWITKHALQILKITRVGLEQQHSMAFNI